MTPCFFPRFSQWVSPDRPFSWKKVLKDEYSGFFAIVAIFTVLEVISDWIVEGTLELDIEWGIFFLAGLAIYTLLLTMKKKRMLEPD